MPETLVVKNLVRWKELYGTVAHVDATRVHVRFDDGESRQFSATSDVLIRIVLANGQHVQVVSTGEVGVVQAQLEAREIMLYKVGLPSGQSPTIVEDDIRPAVLTDPIERLRAGELHTAKATNLRLAAHRLQYAYQYDALSTLGNSRVEMKPHQVGVIHRVANSYPHRFILADEVGLGKTIEAGLLIRELRARDVAQRVLILTPSGLVGQWQQELKTKFNLTFAQYTSDSVRFLISEHPNENVWTLRDSVIASTSYASRDDDRMADIAAAGWDMIVVDEAHHVRRTYGGPNKSTMTRLYRLVNRLSDPDLAQAQAMLLLTATPMQLHRFELYSLIELLDPALFPTFADFETHANALRGLNATVERLKRWPTLSAIERRATLDDTGRWLGHDADVLTARATDDREALIAELEDEHRLSKAMVRNRKRVVGGFMPRVAAIWEVEPSPEEQAALAVLEDYLRTGFKRSQMTENNALGFLMATFGKMSASSSRALCRSLERRIDKLEAVTDTEHRARILDDYDLEETPTSAALDALLAERIDLDWEEVRELERIVELLEAIEIDTKAKVLVANLALIADDDSNAKVIIFTQFRDTQDYIAEILGSRWSVHLFHGGLAPSEKDAAVARFRDDSGLQVLVSTEAGGEGRNFQYCHIMVNYDLPWNPMKVEQRIGRIDRIGQKRPVTIFNFSTLGTIEQRVVEVLTNRIGIFTETIGGLDPILGEVESDLKKIFMAAEMERDREVERVGQRLEARVAEARRAEERLADLIMDTRSYRKDEVEALLQREPPVNADDVRAFALGALSDLGVRVSHDESHAGVYELRFNSRFERLFPDEYRVGTERTVTFELSTALEREEVDFLAFGHPIVDGLVEYVRSKDAGGITSYRTVLTDEIHEVQGWLFVYAIELRGMDSRRDLLPLFFAADGTEQPEVAAWLLDRAMSGRREDYPGAELPARGGDFEAAAQAAEMRVVGEMLGRQQDLEASNAQRLNAERRKLERFFDYRAQAAADKLAANRRTLARLRESVETDDRRILPVWEKNVQTSEAILASVETDRKQKIGELAHRDHVKAQHELMAASYVSVEPDPAPMFARVEAALTPTMYAAFRRMCTRPTPENLLGRRAEVAKRRRDLRKLAESGQIQFDIDLATRIADALIAALEGVAGFTARELTLLSGAIEYYIVLDDEDHDLKEPDGFEDDRAVVNIVLEAIGAPELVIEGVAAKPVS